MTHSLTPSTLNPVATYSHFLGCGVTVQYRVGDILLSASGTFVGDCGRSIFLEQHLEPKQGQRKYFRWEIPYPYIHRIEPESEVETPTTRPAPSAPVPKVSAATAGAGKSVSVRSILPLPPNPDTV